MGAAGPSLARSWAIYTSAARSPAEWRPAAASSWRLDRTRPALSVSAASTADSVAVRVGSVGVGPPGERTRCGALGLAGVGQDVADQGDELTGAERAGQPAPGADRVAAHGQAAGAGGPGVGDQEDDRRAQGPADAPGVQAGHGEIDYGRGVRSAGQLGQRRLGAGDQPDPEPVLAQVAGRHLGHLGLVLGQQDRDRLASRRVARHRPGLPPLCRPSGPGRGSTTPTWSRCPRRAAAGADQDGQTGPT